MVFHNRFLATVIVFCALLVGQAQGQLIGKMDDRVILSDFPFNITSYGADQKVPQSQVLSLVKDPKSGLIVFSTMNGVAEYDGYKISPYPIPEGLEFDVYKKLFFGKNSKHLYGWTSQGVLVVVSDSLKNLGHFGAVHIDSTYWVIVDMEGKLTFRKELEGTVRYINTAIQNPTFVKPVSDSRIIISDKKNTYNISLPDGKIEKFLPIPLIAAHLDTTALYLVGRNTLYEERNGVVKRNSIFDGVKPEINDFLKIGKYLVFTSFKGLYAIVNTELHHFDDIDVLPTRQLTSLLHDKEENNMYTGTADKGFLKFSPKYFINYYKKGKRSRGSASSVVAVGDSMVINSGFRSLMSTDLEGNVRYLMGHSIFASINMYGDTVLAGSWDNGLWVYSLKTRQPLAYYNLDKDNIHAPFRDRSGVFWIGGSNGLYSGRNLHQLTKFEPAFFKSIITTLKEDRNGKLWIGGANGLVILDENRKIQQHFNRSNGLKAKEVRAFYEDKEGRMWIGTYGGGLYCYTDNKLVSLRAFPNYLLGEDIFTLAKDTFGNLLMTSNNGLRIVQEEALIRFLKGESDYLIPYLLSTQSGIYNPEFNGGFINNYASIKGHYFFFPTIQGIVRYDAVQFKPASYHLRIKQVILDGEPANLPTVIPRLTKYIRIELQNAHLSVHNNVYYQYRLSTYNEQGSWSTPQKGTILTFSQLKPGNYKLEVRAIDASNLPNPAVLTYSFLLEPHFYEQPWFSAGVFVLGSLLVTLLLWWAFRRKQKIAEEEMALKNTIIELQLRAIQAQMNPHFIFNVLNRLVEMIGAAKLIQAERFVIEFSKLLRNILEQSDKDFITIREELKTLQIYMDIQRTRRMESFQYNILCDPALENIQIPTMLIQPFIENSIIHGVDHAEYATLITLRLYKESDELHILIQDNGIGRMESAKINQNEKKESKGIQLIKRKIDLLRTKYKTDILLVIDDLQATPPVGTEVHMIIKQA